MTTASIILGILAGIGVLVLLFKPFFGDKEEFWDCVKARADIVSLFYSEYFEDLKSELKLGLWIFCGVIAGFGVYAGLMKLFGVLY